MLTCITIYKPIDNTPPNVLIHHSLVEVLRKQLLNDNRLSKGGIHSPTGFLRDAQTPDMNNNY